MEQEQKRHCDEEGRVWKDRDKKRTAGHTCCVSPILGAGKDYWERRRDQQAGEAAE